MRTWSEVCPWILGVKWVSFAPGTAALVGAKTSSFLGHARRRPSAGEGEDIG